MKGMQTATMDFLVSPNARLEEKHVEEQHRPMLTSVSHYGRSDARPQHPCLGALHPCVSHFSSFLARYPRHPRPGLTLTSHRSGNVLRQSARGVPDRRGDDEASDPAQLAIPVLCCAVLSCECEPSPFERSWVDLVPHSSQTSSLSSSRSPVPSRRCNATPNTSLESNLRE